MHWFFIINPESGSQRAKKVWPEIANALTQAGIEFSHAFTTHAKHAGVLCSQALLEGQRQFVAVGGDGTLNEVLQAICQNDHIVSECTLTCFPIGTGNDWAHWQNIPKDPKAFALLLQNNIHAKYDIGQVYYGPNYQQRHAFINMFGAGFDSYLLQKMGAAKGKRLKYYWHLLKGLWCFRSPNMHISPKAIAQPKSLMLMACLGKYGGAGMCFAPDANSQDGFLDIITIGDLPFLKRLLSLPYLLNGKIKKHPKVLSGKMANAHIDASPSLMFQCDGELIGQLPAKVLVQKKVLNIVSPRAVEQH